MQTRRKYGEHKYTCSLAGTHSGYRSMVTTKKLLRSPLVGKNNNSRSWTRLWNRLHLGVSIAGVKDKNPFPKIVGNTL
jgi:hypothetical protein